MFERRPRERKYRATFIDQGFCFNAGEWNFPDSPLRGVYARNQVYRRVTGWESFEPWLSRVEGMGAGVLWEIAEAVPPEWYGGDLATIERLIEQMLAPAGASERVDWVVSGLESGAFSELGGWGDGCGASAVCGGDDCWKICDVADGEWIAWLVLEVEVVMARVPCEFFLIRYVPDVVKGEFTNIGVVLREATVSGGRPVVRFTRDWSRVRCMDAEADTGLLESLEGEIVSRLQAGVSARDPKGGS